MEAILEVPLDRLDDRDLVLEHDVHHVAARLGAQAHAVADGQPVRGRRPARVSQRAVQFRQPLRPEALGAGQQRRGARIDRRHVALLLVCHRQDAQDEDFVDLGGVEQIAGTLRRDLAGSRRG